MFPCVSNGIPQYVLTHLYARRWAKHAQQCNETHNMWVWKVLMIKPTMLKKTYSIYIMTMSHWTFEIIFGSSQETPHFLLNPSYDGIVMTKNIKNIKMLCKQWTTKSKCSQSLLWNLSKSWMSRLITFFHIPYIL